MKKEALGGRGKIVGMFSILGSLRAPAARAMIAVVAVGMCVGVMGQTASTKTVTKNLSDVVTGPIVLTNLTVQSGSTTVTEVDLVKMNGVSGNVQTNLDARVSQWGGDATNLNVNGITITGTITNAELTAGIAGANAAAAAAQSTANTALSNAATAQASADVKVATNNGSAWGLTLNGNTTNASRTVVTKQGALSASAWLMTGSWASGGTTATTVPYWLIEPSGTTAGTWSVNGTGFGMNAASGYNGNFLDFQVAGIGIFSINSGGNVNAGSWNGTSGTFSGNLTVNGSGSHIFNGEIIGGSTEFRLNSAGLALKSGGYFAWGPTAGNANSPDTFLVRDAANAIAQRNGTNAQVFNFYKTYADASNYERVNHGFDGTGYLMEYVKAGSGSVRSLRFKSGSAILDLGSNNGFYFGSTSANWWNINSFGYLLTVA